MKMAPLADVKACLSAYIDHVETEGPVVITRNGKPVAVLLALRDPEELEHLMLAHSPRFQALFDESRASVRAGKRLARNAFWRAVAERRRRKSEAGPKVHYGSIGAAR
jgi:prevent-host-death family protein